ncbi:MAG: hypothetical protein OMM_12184 [Candidatus Magnetoglobus multicellularis str. Araruama]|uniref:Uncharacterized protein n=1 Tax=Candidatus Magnetoglobus multicellularis str. Araruama TaxID=890399 RepID=A0A1V1NWH6_9BACT|nr:MAG: hypothetical protein OMM_12184 [Candidatus Magnetoglobus multicellularis str. Araruama]
MRYESIIEQKKGELNLLNKDLISNKEKLEQLSNKLPSIEKAQVLLQTIAQDTQNQLKFHIQDIVDTGLDTCFPGQYVCKN